MNTATIKGNWNITKGKLKQKYAQLTDDDLIYVEGQEDALIRRIQKRANCPRAEIEIFLRDECACDFAPAEPAGAARNDDNGHKPNPAFSRSNPSSSSQDVAAGQRRSPTTASFKK